MDAAHTGLAGDGIVVIIPVERMYRIRAKAEAKYEKA
jgi:nitrogen regulatory protein PII